MVADGLTLGVSRAVIQTVVGEESGVNCELLRKIPQCGSRNLAMFAGKPAFEFQEQQKCGHAESTRRRLCPEQLALLVGQ